MINTVSVWFSVVLFFLRLLSFLIMSVTNPNGTSNIRYKSRVVNKVLRDTDSILDSGQLITCNSVFYVNRNTRSRVNSLCLCCSYVISMNRLGIAVRVWEH